MQITNEQVDDLNARLKVKVEPTDYDEKVEEVLKDYRKKVTMNGFRPGKVPAGLVKKMYYKPVLVEEINKLVSESIASYLKEEEIRILGEPLPSEEEREDIDWDKQKEFEFSFDLGLAPAMEISFSQRDKVPRYDVQVDQKMIDDTKASYKQRLGKMIPVDAIEGEETLKVDLVQIDKEGQEIEGGITAEDSMLSLQVVQDKAVKTSFMARQAGDAIDLDIRKSFPNENEIASLLKIDKTAVAEISPNFRLTIKEISRFQEAEINQDFYDQLYGKDEVKSNDEFEGKIREELKKGMARDSEYRFGLDVKQLMLKKLKIKLPVEFLKRWLVIANENKFSKEQIEEDFPKFEDDLKWQLIRDEIAKKNEVKVEADEVKEEARQAALMQFQQYGIMDVPEENLNNYAEEMLKNEDESRKLIERILEQKVVNFVSEQVKVDQKQISLEKFRKLFENN